MTEQKQRRAWLYCRSATGDKVALENQMLRISAYAKREGYAIIGASQDGCSGSTLDRKGLNEAVIAVSEKKADVVLAVNISRIGRDLLKVLKFEDMLKRQGVEIVTLEDNSSDMRQTLEMLAGLFQTFIKEERAKKQKARRERANAKKKIPHRQMNYLLNAVRLSHSNLSVSLTALHLIFCSF